MLDCPPDAIVRDPRGEVYIKSNCIGCGNCERNCPYGNIFMVHPEPDRSIVGWIKTIEWLQWYDVRSEAGGVLESDAHQRGSVECLSVLEGEFEVEAGGVTQRAKQGETLRYRCDRPHIVRCIGEQPGRAMMVCILKAAVMD